MTLLRWLLVLVWTILTLALTLMPGSEGSTVKTLSLLAGGTEITDAMGHAILFGIYAILWCHALRQHRTKRQTGQHALIIVLLFGLGTESLQAMIPNRGTSVLDMLANTLSPSLAVFIWYFWR